MLQPNRIIRLKTVLARTGFSNRRVEVKHLRALHMHGIQRLFAARASLRDRHKSPPIMGSSRMMWSNLSRILMSEHQYSPVHELASPIVREGRLPPRGGTLNTSSLSFSGHLS
jgi:hypothetical protein